MQTLLEPAVMINPKNLGARASRLQEPFCYVDKWLAEFLEPALHVRRQTPRTSSGKGRGRDVPSPGRAWWPPLRGIEEDPGGAQNLRDSLVKFR